MSELHEILNQLKALGFQLNPPATQDQLDYLTGQLGIQNELPEEVLELYRHHNGMPVGAQPVIKQVEWPLKLFDMRFMPVEEVIEFNRAMDSFYQSHDIHLVPILENARFLWQDDNANAIGIYISGDLKGKIFILDHEVLDISPRFGSISSMYQQWLVCSRFNLENKDAIDDEEVDPCWAMSTWEPEYPRTKPSEFDEEELEIAISCLKKSQNTKDLWDRQVYLYSALNLLPYRETKILISLLDDSNANVQQRAKEFFYLRRYGMNIDLLAELLVDGSDNARAAAIYTLGTLKTLEAEQKLLEVLPKTEQRWKDSIRQALRWAFNYEIKKLDKRRYAYRKTENDEWTEF